MATTLSQISAPVYMCSRGLRHLSSAPPLSGTVGRPEMSTEGGQDSKAAQAGTGPRLGVGVDRGNMQTKHVCMCACEQLRLARVRAQNCVGIKKNMRWQTRPAAHLLSGRTRTGLGARDAVGLSLVLTH